MTQKIMYFLAGAVATVDELEDITALNALTPPAYEVVVRNTLVPSGGKLEDTDYVAGTIPTAYNDAEDYPVFNPDTARASVAAGDVCVVDNSADTKHVNGVVDIDAGVVSVNLPATAALITTGQALTGVTPSGAFLTTVTFTVAAGVITAIVLS